MRPRRVPEFKRVRRGGQRRFENDANFKATAFHAEYGDVRRFAGNELVNEIRGNRRMAVVKKRGKGKPAKKNQTPLVADDSIQIPPFPPGDCTEGSTYVLTITCIEGNLELGWLDVAELTVRHAVATAKAMNESILRGRFKRCPPCGKKKKR